MSLFGRSDRDAEDRNVAGPEGSGGAPKTAQGEPRPARAPVGAAGGPGGKMANIGKSITIKGDLTGNEHMVIEGNVEGKVELPTAELTIGATLFYTTLGEPSKRAEGRVRKRRILPFVPATLDCPEKELIIGC